MDAISSGSSEEGIMILEAPIGLSSAQDIHEEKFPETIDPIGQFKSFLKEGGDREVFRKLLITLYGKKLIRRAFPKGWKETLSRENCIEIVERLGQAMTINDLEGFYAELKSGAIQSAILKSANLPYWRMWRVGSIRDLPPYWMNDFLSFLRNPFKHLQIEAEFEKGVYIQEKATSYVRYTHALKRLEEKGDRSRPEFSYASRELLARTVAYTDPTCVFDGAMIPLYHPEMNREVFYTLKGQIHDNGLHAYLFTPLEKGKELPAQLIFRGTNDSAAIGRDLDPTGVGNQVFKVNSDKIETLVKKANVHKIEVIGHSLGAADAQRAAALFIDPKRGFDFKEISLFSFCAPRLEIEKIKEWKEHLQIVSEQRRRPIIRLNFAYHANDPVTWTGDGYLIGSELDCVYTNYLIVRSRSGLSQTLMHHNTPFFMDGNFNFDVDGRTFQFLRGFPNRELLAEIEKLKKIENSWQWWHGLKSYFVHVESKEEVEKKIEEMKSHQAEIGKLESGISEQSWLVYSAWNAVRYHVQPFLYRTFEEMRSLANRRY